MQLKEHFHFQFAATLEFHAFMQLCIIIKRWRWEWRCRWEKIWKKCIAYGYSKEHYHKNVLYFFSFWYLFRFAQQLALSYMKEHLTADAWSKPQTSNAFCNQWRRFYYCLTWDGGDPLTAIGVGVHVARWQQNGASNPSAHIRWWIMRRPSSQSYMTTTNQHHCSSVSFFMFPELVFIHT